ncbi:MAG TPA: tetratricopeptide repeat protein, partial [Cyclobacteriaceae bacterium]|nr:tetratricopeptide repeat protein [Cyclobacteriaceae bacterium]
LLLQNKTNEALRRLEGFGHEGMVKMSKEEAFNKSLWPANKGTLSEKEAAELAEFLKRSREAALSGKKVTDSVWVQQPDVKSSATGAITRNQPRQISKTIQDDIYWLEANLRMQRGEFEASLKLLEKIQLEFPDDILADDAAFMEGDIYENYLKNKEKAMDIFRAFLDKYPGSVYAAEARKRYRNLRGDFQPEKKM